jgi:hypothetical protein
MFHLIWEVSHCFYKFFSISPSPLSICCSYFVYVATVNGVSEALIIITWLYGDYWSFEYTKVTFLRYILEIRREIQKECKCLSQNLLLFSCIWKWQPDPISCWYFIWFDTLPIKKFLYLIAWTSQRRQGF